jgi:hypothetical protein
MFVKNMKRSNGMIFSYILLGVLFLVTWLIHKPLDIHSIKKGWVQQIHIILETAFTAQVLIVLNALFRSTLE